MPFLSKSHPPGMSLGLQKMANLLLLSLTYIFLRIHMCLFYCLSWCLLDGTIPVNHVASFPNVNPISLSGVIEAAL